MPDRRRHRGQHPEDERLFADSWVKVMQQAVNDLSLLRGRGYSAKASLKLVGDRFRLEERQRIAVERCTGSEEALRTRKKKQLPPNACKNRRVYVDGFNQLITLESALSGGILLRGRDGTLRDLAGVHGSYRMVEETGPALDLLGRSLAELHASEITVCLDQPVSNSGRLKRRMLDECERNGWDWQVELVHNPDRHIVASGEAIISSDSWMLDNGACWLNLVDSIVAADLPEAVVIAL